MAMDQYLLIQFLVGWTSIYQLFWCSPGVQGFDTLPYKLQGKGGFLCDIVVDAQHDRLTFDVACSPEVECKAQQDGAQGVAGKIRRLD